VIILLTDGQNNCGRRTMQDAAKLCAEWKIKVYAIGVGGGDAVTTIQTPFGAYKFAAAGPSVDEAALAELAQATGGLFRMAHDADSLKAIYQEIDRLERSEVESIRFLDYREMFVPFALAALAVLILEVLLLCTVFRRIP
jgi:Ca-activated chloride channel family protein